ncbi:MAG: SgcJ/EcaC family oxidoreductase [Gemmatimonadota bacterium]|nr:SgcJ/EcaC family oxidoreductase [Gemmatimonadota bacterium]
MKRAAAAGLALLSALVTADATAQSQDPEVQSAASNALSAFIASWNRAAAGDSLGYAQYRALYWPDADLVDPSGNVWNDQNGIVQMHVDLWNAPFKGSVVDGKLRKARRLSPTVLVADFDLTLKLAGPPPPSGPGSGGPVKAHLKMVMTKRGSEWKTISSQNTFFSDSPPPAATPGK